MVMRDASPRDTLGYGVNFSDLPIRNEEEAGSPDSGLIARHLEGSPLKKFFATAGATIVGATVAGMGIRKQGLKGLNKLATNAADHPDSVYSRMYGEYRRVQKILDEYGGVGTRVVDDLTPSNDRKIYNSGFFMTDAERRSGNSVAEWTLKREMQQQLVKQARRLPYELPAAYVTTKLTDPILGNESERVNWMNPVDVVGDFASTSLQNLAFAFVPFEGGAAAARHGWRKALSSTADSNYSGLQKSARNAVVDVNRSLSFIGQEFGDLVAKSIKVSRGTTGAMSTSIVNSAAKQRSLVDHLNLVRKQVQNKGAVKGAIDYYGMLKSGEEVISPALTARDVFRNMRKYGSKGAGAPVGGAAEKTTFEELIESVQRLAYRGSEFTDETFQGGDFFTQLAQSRYRKLLGEELAGSGVNKEAADFFSFQAGLDLPTSSPAHLTHRVRFGGKIQTETLEEGLNKRLRAVVGADDADAITSNIQGAMRRADESYSAGRDEFVKDARRQWNDTFQQGIVPRTREILGGQRASFSSFERGEGAEFLVRRTAERAGVATSVAGKPVSTASLKRELERLGMKTDRNNLRGFLVQEGDISKPWRAQGRNVFGLKSLTVGDAMRRGYFDDSDQIGDIKDFTRAVQRSDWDSGVLDRMKLGGVYETRSGDIINTNELTKPFMRGVKRFSEEVKVPFIQLRPGEMYRSFFGRPSENLLEFSTIRSPFLQGGEGAQGYLWAQTGRGGRGETTAMVDGRAQLLPGRSKSMDSGTDAVRYAAKMQDRFSYGERGRVATALGFDGHQPDSLIDLAKRYKSRKTDINNPAVLAREILSGKSFDEITGVAGRTSETVADSAKNMFTFWRQQMIPKQVQRMAMRQGDDSALKTLVTGGRKEGTSLYDMRNDELRRYVRELMGEDLGGLDKGSQGVLRSARKQLLDSWQKPGSLDTPVTKSATSGGTARMKDKLVLDLIRYNSIKGAVNEGMPYEVYAKQMTRELGDMEAAGLIGRREAAEARTAIGSVNQIYQGLRFYDKSQSLQTNTLNQLQLLMRSDPISTESALREVLEETAEYGTSGDILRKVRKQFGVSKQDYDGVELNPFGGARTYVPTFGSVFERSPFGAVKSAMGYGTWRDQDNFSVASMASTRLVTRVNDAMGTFGMRVGGDFAGPMDMLGRGMVGKRALPIFGVTAAALSIDRTAGGLLLNERDDDGNRVYQPLVFGGLARGGVELQALASGIAPGGMTAEEKREQMLSGEVAVRRGRFWPLGHQPWEGGKVDYYRPSWYRRFTSGYQYTEESFGTPMEQLLFGYDFSPLRPLDPYRYERRTHESRPYPLSGDYFSGPWGPITPMLNATVGRVLKPQRKMHEQEMEAAMSQYQPVGMYGMAPPSVDMPRTFAVGGTESPGGVVAPYVAAAGTPAYSSGSSLAESQTLDMSQRYLAAVGRPNQMSRGQMPQNIMASTNAMSPGSLENQFSEFAYRSQEFAGIYGFAFGALRESLGVGSMEYENSRPMLASASEAYGTSRTFWDWNLGGMGDFPTPLEGEYANLEASELVRRFIPKPRAQNLVNPLRNQMPEWLPGASYFQNLKIGDPFSQVASGEMRLPGIGYERFYNVQRDEEGEYSAIDRLRILGDLCVHPDTYIRMADGSVTLAADVDVGDEVVSHTGESRRISRRGIRDEVGLLEMRVSHIPYQNLRATPEHPIYAVKYTPIDLRKTKKRGVRRTYSKSERAQLNYPTHDPQWIPLGEIEIGDAVLYPIPERGQDTSSLRISSVLNKDSFTRREDDWIHYRRQGCNKFTSDVIELSEDFWYVAGVYVAEGCSNHDNGTLKNMTFSLRLNREEPVANKVEAYFDSITESSIQLKEKPESTSLYVNVYSNLLARLFGELFGKDSYTKRIPKILLNASAEKQRAFLLGAMSGDGCYNDSKRQVSFEYDSVSLPLLLGVRDLLLQNGYISSLKKAKRRDSSGSFNSSAKGKGKGRLSVTGSEAIRLHEHLTGEESSRSVLEFTRAAWISDGFLVSRVEDVHEVDYTGPVVNWTVEEDNSFCVLGYATHNSPYSEEFRETAALARGQSPAEYQEIMARAEEIKRQNNFTQYEHRDESTFSPNRWGEKVAHLDTWFNNKFLPHRSAIEDWERFYVYGSNFPQWNSPYEGFLKPMGYKAADRHPILGAGSFAILGHMMGVSREGKAVGRVLGSMTGFGISSASSARELITGERFLPKERRREIAVEENVDILTYVRGLRGAKAAQASGDTAAEQYFTNQMRSTMYGTDLTTLVPENIPRIAQAIPKRKREHFVQFLQETDPDDQQRILQSAGRLERRIYQAAWGMKVEARPDLGEYFDSRELPDADWQGWGPQASMEQVKIKMLQQEGLNLSQMGYYPQQIAEANLVNPSYPTMSGGGGVSIERLLSSRGIDASVRAIPTPFPGVSMEYMSGG